MHFECVYLIFFSNIFQHLRHNLYFFLRDIILVLFLVHIGLFYVWDRRALTMNLFQDDVPMQRFMTLSSVMKRSAEEYDEDDAAQFNIFNSKTHVREKIAKNIQRYDNRIDRNDKTFNLSELKKVHGRPSTTRKVL